MSIRYPAIRLVRRSRLNRREQEAKTMRVMVIVKASKESEAGVMPDEKMLAEMG